MYVTGRTARRGRAVARELARVRLGFLALSSLAVPPAERASLVAFVMLETNDEPLTLYHTGRSSEIDLGWLVYDGRSLFRGGPSSAAPSGSSSGGSAPSR